MDLMKQKTTNDFMTYATAVIKSRAIPLAEDGLKPVQRRILYVMGEMKLKSSGKTVKSAKVTGDVMGNYHPHGDASIYEALIRMSQEWKMRYPLIYIQGNNGSLNGDKAAAQRYTETKLTAAGEAMLEGLNSDVVKFVPNYDESSTEPSMLSGIFPNLLCNGTEGIAVGFSCSLVPHNLNNVVDLITAHVNNPALSQAEALRLIKGPDFPLGGTIIDGYKLGEIYTKGQGTITLRAKAEIEPKTNSIVFSEFPYLVDVDRIIKSIQSMVLDDGYTDIVEYENHIGKTSRYIRVICQKKANLNKVLNDLYEQTPLQKSVKINNTIIYNGVPMTMSLLGLSNIYINHRHNCIIKMARKELEKQKHIIHIQSGLLLATAKIDDVVALIRSSDSKDQARTKLRALLGVDTEQADAILSLQLGRLTRLDVNDINVKIQKAEEESEIQSGLINIREKRNEVIITNLEALRKKFGDEFRTTIINDEPKSEEEQEQIFPEYVVVGSDYQIYRSSNIDDFKKGGKMGSKTEPLMWTYSNGLPVYCFNNDGTVGEEWSVNSRGLFRYDSQKSYVLTISRHGVAKKTMIGEYKKIQRLCKVKEGDELAFVACVNDNDNIIIRYGDNKVVKISPADVKTSGKLTVGTKICNGAVLNVCVTNDYFYTLNDDMQIKRVDVNDLTRSTAGLNEGCTHIDACEPNMVYWSRGKFTPFDWNKISIKSRTSDGAKISNSEIRVS
jgi:DNA gyrase subunit A